MPAVAFVVGAVLSYTGVTAAITATLVELGASAIVASVGTGAIIGAGSGALSAAIQGGDVAQGALIGGITGGVGAGVSNVIGGALSAPGVGEYGPQLATGSPALDAGIQRGLTGVVTGGLGAGLSGGDPLRGALLGGVTGGISGAAGQALGLGSTGTSALGGALGFGLSAAFPSDQKAQTRGVSAQTPFQPTATGKTTSQALGTGAPMGSALSIAPGIGYSPSSTVFGSGESDKPKSNVWNVESLKGGAEVGPNVS
jgi:hypothetical protein